MRYVLPLALLALAACNSLSPQVVSERAGHVAEAVAERVFPGMSAAPFATCIRETATPQELRALADLTGNVGGSAQVLVLEIATRPAGQACLADRGIVLS